MPVKRWYHGTIFFFYSRSQPGEKKWIKWFQVQESNGDVQEYDNSEKV